MCLSHDTRLMESLGSCLCFIKVYVHIYESVCVTTNFEVIATEMAIHLFTIICFLVACYMLLCIRSLCMSTKGVKVS